MINIKQYMHYKRVINFAFYKGVVRSSQLSFPTPFIAVYSLFNKNFRISTWKVIYANKIEF